MSLNTNENIEDPEIEVEIADKFEKLFLPKRYKVFYGGRGGAKTVTFTKIALVLAVQEDKKFLCLREFMNSIDESVHNSLKEEIEKMGVQEYYKVREKYIDVIGGRGGFRYNQLARNLGSLKSKRGFNVAWVEEAETISDKSLQTLIPTIREDDSELWFSFNPESEQGAVYAEFVKPHIKEIIRDGYYEDQDLLVVKVGLEDNPFDTPTLTRQSDVMKETNYRQWLHIFGGECYANYEDAIIKPEWVDAAIDAHIKIGFKPMGIKSLGFDPADTGDDDKAYALRHGSVVTHAKAWSTGDLPDAIDRAFDAGYDLRAQVLVYDADGREEETDIVYASEMVGPDEVRFLRKHGGGLICTTISDNLAEQVGLPFLTDVFKSAEAMHPVLRNSLPDTLPYDTKSAFSLTINHRKCYTGITDKDRAMTVAEFGALVREVEQGNLETPLNDFTRMFRIPGHLFLLRTSKEILKDRFGHTELSTAMCIMAGLPSSATICEMMGDDGDALSREAAKKLAIKNECQLLEGKEVVEAWKAWSA